MQDNFVEAGVLIPYSEAESSMYGYDKSKPIVGFLQKEYYDLVQQGKIDLNCNGLMWYQKINNEMSIIFKYNIKKIVTPKEAEEEYPYVYL